MERKTIEQIYEESAIFITKGKKRGTYSLIDVVSHAMQAYADQERRIVVSKALDELANQSQEMIYDRKDTQILESGSGLILRDYQVCYAVPKQSILSYRDKILEELSKTT